MNQKSTKNSIKVRELGGEKGREGGREEGDIVLVITIGVGEESGEGRWEEGGGELGEERFEDTGDDMNVVGLWGKRGQLIVIS